ncbi:N-acetylmuramoyl-L-alanine amidase [Paenibacillus sp. PL91]|uniref:N-acetylmuramoyl-L-alanine amidase family protein n=1 Tax=Paenibacillus sp. PL91 TaxID=2729538 RepID=UPI00145EA596|nr:N-acetylmuramoyl-L-alanine amidase [Paenibacillus sp. PL91]MBC9200826.1 N-acetylmuramoyl-L-alanine amidase [Paenibacillus sp. PL91]
MLHPYTRKRKTRLARLIVFLFILLLIAVSVIGIAANKQEKPNALSAIPTTKPVSQLVEDHLKETYKIVIDAGHGGKDPGAEGVSGQREKLFTLSLSLKVYDLLKQEDMFEPYLTRSDDNFIDLDKRPDIANQMNADAFVSIHANTFTDESVGGTETFYRHDDSVQLAQSVHDKVVKEMGFQDRGIKNEQLKVLSLSKVPAILLEVGYLTNPSEEATLLGEDGQARAARAIVDGLKQYFTNKPQDAIIHS